jgi:photosystem II stability/assembly factor-like uncharacterized protein
MKKFKILFVALILLTINLNLFSQDCWYGWYSVNLNSTSHLHSIYFPTKSVGYIAGWWSEVIKTTNGGNNWFRPPGSPNMDIQCVYFVNDTIGWLSGGAGAIRHTTNGGNSWTVQQSGTYGILYIVYFKDVNTGWISGDYGKILKTTNGGQNWISKPSGTTYNLTCVYFVNKNTGWITGDHGTLLKSTNGGENWFALNSGVQTNIGKLFFINKNTGWVSGDFGKILKTTNGGTNWVQQQSGTSCWLISPFFVNKNIGWIAGVNGVIIKTTNGGNNWFSQISHTSNEFRSNFFLNANTGFTVGFYGTVLKTKTGGSHCPMPHSPLNGSQNVSVTPTLTWGNFTGITNYTINISTDQYFQTFIDTAVVPFNQYSVSSGKLSGLSTYFWRIRGNSVLGPTAWSDVWSFTTENTVSINPNINYLPTEYKLYSNYPNPFNPATKIKFDVPKTALTQLIIYDEIGRTITTLANSIFKAGQYEIIWNAEKLNSGIYFVRMISDNYVETRKMVLVK